MDFDRIISSKLAPVLAELGYAGKPEGRHGQQYDGAYFSIHVIRDPRGELGFNISSIKGGPQVGMSMVLPPSDPDWALSRSITFSNADRLSVALDRFSKLLQRNAEILTTRNDQLISAALAAQTAKAKEWAEGMQLENALRKAEQCWKGKDYRGYVTILEPWEPRLTSAAKAKLAFCKRQS